MKKTLILTLAALALLLGCAAQTPGTGADTPSRTPMPSEQPFEVKTLTYPIGSATLSALRCEPNTTTARTPGIVLTGGDGVTAQKLRSACEAFAAKGFVTLAHDNVENGSAQEDIEAVAEAARMLRADAPDRPIALWGHSAGTIFSAVAAYQPGVRPYAFVETSGHLQIPICDAPGSASPVGGECIAYWSQFPAPILIVHGLNDSVVDAAYADAFSKRLSDAGKFHRKVRVADAGHEFMLDKPGVLDAEAGFLREQLNGSG